MAKVSCNLSPLLCYSLFCTLTLFAFKFESIFYNMKTGKSGLLLSGLVKVGIISKWSNEQVHYTCGVFVNRVMETPPYVCGIETTRLPAQLKGFIPSLLVVSERRVVNIMILICYYDFPHYLSPWKILLVNMGKSVYHNVWGLLYHYWGVLQTAYLTLKLGAQWGMSACIKNEN